MDYLLSERISQNNHLIEKTPQMTIMIIIPIIITTINIT